MPKRKRKRKKKVKRKLSKAQLSALSKGRAKRRRNLAKKHVKPKGKKRKITKNPMAKRRRTNVLTGGTKDVNPQFIHGTVTTLLADELTESSFPLPISRLQQTGTPTIIELIKIWWMPAANIPHTDALVTQAQTISFSTISQGELAMATFFEPNVFCQFHSLVESAFTAAGSIMDHRDMPHMQDFTDGAGHGLLLATDRFFVQWDTDNFAVARRTYFKILYRFKRVTLTEYIGIVQSQQ